MIDHPEARAIFAEYGITVVSANAIVGPGQTRALATLDRIRRRYGADRARFVVMTLAETANNKAAIDETTLWAISDMVRAAERHYPDLLSNRVSDWLEFFDGIPLGVLAYWCRGLDGIASKRHALGGMVWERMWRHFGELAVQPDLLDDREVNIALKNQYVDAIILAGRGRAYDASSALTKPNLLGGRNG